jgi:putative acetyltransferase
MDIRDATMDDLDGILDVYSATFDGPENSLLLASLYNDENIKTSLVAVEYGEIIAHIAFSDLEIICEDHNKQIKGSALASLAVAPTHQNIGIGTELTRQGLELCVENGDEAIFIGTTHAFFNRFGFEDIHDDFIKTYVSGQFFMVLMLKHDVFDDFSGTIEFPDAFDI